MPKSASDRVFVPDLAPYDRAELKGLRPRVIFVAESPHTSEIEPEQMSARRPLCGAAGRKWWKALGEILDVESSEDVSLERMLSLCRKHRVVVMNAVQRPLDPKADATMAAGFTKIAGLTGYKKLKDAPVVRDAVADLRSRLAHPSLADVPVHCLGLDAEWFVKRALGEEGASRIGERIPHPSAWWRRGGHFGRVAREALERILAKH